MVFSSIDRVITSLKPKEPDRIPFDLGEKIDKLSRNKKSLSLHEYEI